MEDPSNLTDRISELPHDILGGSILSMLPLKEAAATGLDEKEKGSSLTPFRCGYGGFELLGVLHLFIEICDANLVSFVYVGFKINVILSNMPSLVEVSLYEFSECSRGADFLSLAFTQLSSFLSQLETLMLNIEGDYSCAFPVPTLPNLKHLELIVPADDQWALNNLNSFLKASPSLQRLVLKLEFSPPPCKPLEEKLQLLSCELREELRILLFEPPKMLKAPECPHRNLKIVEIVGYCGRINVVEHVIFNRKIKDVKEEEEARDHAMHQLKQMVPSTVQFEKHIRMVVHTFTYLSLIET
ncbi:hypothetical protein L3X38_019286 [Prunus dulcis]|uniref:At1g61320/AtMIF1 LRR domain-containing protein n=1 Tax=Prunus dulcis TaxID=3755 RepID=A0AAD4ZAX2_PRUDU|nr:hypothetical protein L3X38_019286 [Prunus dulcis]